MRPIRDLAEVTVGAVLWHSAFGFARVHSVDDDSATLDWARRGENLPGRVLVDGLFRAYALCPTGGFFHLALDRSESLRDLIQVDPPEAARLLLDDLDGPQAKSDIRDWMGDLELLSEHAFERWWQRLSPMIADDARFRVDGDLIAIRDRDPGDVRARLQSTVLSPARRLDLAIQHRQTLGEDEFRGQVLAAWRTGNPRVRDLALGAVAGLPVDDVITGLIGPGSEAIDALIHALRHADWPPERVSTGTLRKLIDRFARPATSSGDPLDSEGRLAAAVWRWGAPGVEEALAALAGSARGAVLIEAALAALPPRRAESLAVAMFRATSADGAAGRRAIAAWLIDHAEDGAYALVERVAAEHPVIAEAIRTELDARARTVDRDDATMDSEEHQRTTEIAPAPFQQASRLSEFPPLISRDLLRVGLGLAVALRDQHLAGRIVGPTVHSILVHSDGHVEIAPDAERHAPRTPNEAPSPASDLYAAGIVLIEAILGKAWPRPLSGDRALPFLRHCAASLPPTALGPLAAVVDPLPEGRVDADTWVRMWQAALAAEDARATAADSRGRIRIGYDTHIGRMKVLHTQTNQDALYVASKGTQSLLAVCDGISTANTGSGDLAASISAQVVASLWEQALPRLVGGRAEDAHEFLDRALRTANQAVCEASLRLAGGKLDGRVPMGSTSVVAVGQGNRLSIAWLGDSRAYLVGPHGASQLTADANQAGERIVDWQHGLLSQFDATGFALVRYVGHFDEAGVAEPIPAMHTELVLLPGERLVICSDGVTDYIATSQAEACAVLHEVALQADVDTCARGLIDLANRGGGGDNATVIVAGVA